MTQEKYINRRRIYSTAISFTLFASVITTLFVGATIFLGKEATATPHSGSTTGDEEWLAVDNPHVVTANFTVEINHNLTLEPGVRVEFVENTHLRIKGRLIASGDQNIITFTSIYGAPKPEQYWEAILIDHTSRQNIIDHTEIEYANYGVYSSCTSLKVSNNTISSTWYAGIYTYNSNPVIYNNTVTLNDGWGIKIEESSMPVISYNEVTFNDYDGIYSGRNSRPTITNNAVNSNYNNGIKCMEGSTPIIKNNEISSNMHDGIYVYSASPQILYNIVTANNHTGIRVSSSSSAPLIENNTISSNLKNGIVCLYGANPNIKSNIISNNDQDTKDLYPAIYIDDSNPVISQNNISSNNAHGIYITNAASPNIEKNTIKNNYLGIYIEGSAPQIVGDTISLNTHDGIFMDSSSPTLTGVAISSNGDDGVQVVSSSPVIEDCLVSSNTDNNVQSSSSIFTIANSSISLSNGNDFDLSENSHMHVLNTTFDNTSVSFSDAASILEVQWYLSVFVLDSKGDKISGANVVVKDASRTEIYNGTCIGGKVKWIQTTQYTQDQVSKIIHTPHNISASRDASTAYSDQDPTMDANKEVTIFFPFDLGISVPTGLNVNSLAEGGGLNITWDPNPEEDLTGYILYISLDKVSYDVEAVLTAKNNYYIDFDLIDGQEYYYRISAANSTNESGLSEPVKGIPGDILPPMPPTNLTAVRGYSEDSLVLIWHAVGDEDVMGYNVYRAETPDGEFELIAKLGLQNEYTDYGLETYTTYYYKVTAFDEVPNESEYSKMASNTTWDTEPPITPEDLKIEVIPTGNTLNLSWISNAEDDFNHYTVYIGTNNLTFNVEATVPPSPHPYYLDTNLTNGKMYYYKLSASDYRPNESPLSESIAGMPMDTIIPSPPTGLIVSYNPNPDALNLSWNPNSEEDVVGYNIYRSESSGGPYTLVTTVGLVAKFQDIGLASDIVYYYVITAFDEVPNYSTFSNEANGTTTDTVPPAAPKNVIVTPMPEGNALNISWDQNTELDLDHYNLFRSTNNVSFQLRAMIPAGKDYFLDTELADGVTYYYALSAFDEVPNESLLSKIANGTPADIMAPAEPTGLVVTLGPTQDSLNLTWDLNSESDMAGYFIYRSEMPGGPYSYIDSVGLITHYQDTGLSSETTFYYVIQAFDEVPNFSSFSPEAFRTTADYTAPSTPANLTVTPVLAGNALNISWDASPEPDVMNYVLYSSTDNLTFFVESTVLAGTEYYIDSNLIDGKTYYYMIYAKDEVPNYSNLSDVASGIPQDTLSPATPTGLKVVDIQNAEGALNISWDPVTTNLDGSACSDLVSYSLYRNETGTWVFLYSIPAGNEYFIDTNLVDGMLYNYSIKALDEMPNESPLSSAGSNFSIDDLSPATPTKLDARATSNSGELNITWNPVTTNLDGSSCIDLVNYTLYRNGTTPGIWIFVANISAGTEFYVDTGLIDYVQYNYTIWASDEIPNYSPLSLSDSGIPFDNVSPAQPKNLTAKDEINSEGALNLSWDENSDMDLSHYLIYSNRSGNWEILALVPKGTQYYIDRGLIDGVIYYYNISAVDYSGNEGNQSFSASNYSVDDLSPSTPAGLVVEDFINSERMLNISWNAVNTNADGSPCIDLVNYTLYTNKSGVWQLLAIIPVGKEYYIDSLGLFDGPTYYYRISASDEVPNTSPNSTDAYGQSIDDLPPSAPTGLTVITSPQGNTLNINWTPNPEFDVISYTLLVSTNNVTFDVEAVIPAGANNYTDTSLIDGKVYYYMIKATDEVPNYSLPSGVVSGVPSDSTAPSAPTGLTATYGPTSDSLSLMWNQNSETDLAGYIIYRSATEGGPYTLLYILGQVMEYVDMGLDSGVTYYYVITAFDEVPNNSPYSSEANFTTKYTIPPSAPTGLTVSVIQSGNALNISWQANLEPNLAFYSIYHSLDNLSFTWLADIAAGTEYFVDTGLKNNVTYFYLLTATDAVPNESPVSIVVNGTPADLEVPFPPTYLIVSPGSTPYELVLYWNASMSLDVRGYNVYRSTTEGGPYEFINSTFLVTYYVDRGLLDKTTYYYVITAFDETPNESSFSIEASGFTPDTTAPSIPMGLNVFIVPKGNALNISWDAVSDDDVLSYNVYRSVDNITFVFFASTPEGIEYYLDTNLSDGKTYYYIVKAIDEVPNESGVSEVVLGTPKDTVPPSAPLNLTATTGLVYDSVKLSWDANIENDLMGYTVYHSTAPQGPYFWFATLGLETVYYIHDLEDVITYYYVIDAFDEVPNNSTKSNECYWIAPDRTPPLAPTGLTAFAQDVGSNVLLSWNPNTEDDLDHYSVYRGLDNLTFVWIANVPAGNMTYTDEQLVNGIKYFYTIAAVDEVPNRSPLSNIVSVIPKETLPPSIPMGLKVTALESKNALLISWNPNIEPDLLYYVLYRSEDNVTFIWIANISAGTINYTDTDIQPGKIYYYKIKAVDTSFQESGLSEAVEGIVSKDVVEDKGEKDKTLLLTLLALIVIIIVLILLLLLWLKRSWEKEFGEDMEEEKEQEEPEKGEEKAEEEHRKEDEVDKESKMEEPVEEGKRPKEKEEISGEESTKTSNDIEKEPSELGLEETDEDLLPPPEDL
ncbi:MAG: right-handed parallel beta-helix repeat-containing protein [Thermoplasmata archaeon]|nr:MAG: right-handed parallel beta-helix repeat-containing protein [Thermoplasmata archaeon]